MHVSLFFYKECNSAPFADASTSKAFVPRGFNGFSAAFNIFFWARVDHSHKVGQSRLFSVTLGTPTLDPPPPRSAQIRNIDGVADHVRWLIRRGETEGDALSGLVDPHRPQGGGWHCGAARPVWGMRGGGLNEACQVCRFVGLWPGLGVCQESDGRRLPVKKVFRAFLKFRISKASILQGRSKSLSGIEPRSVQVENQKVKIQFLGGDFG